MSDKELTPSAYPTCKQLNTRDLPTLVLLPDTTDFKRITISQSNTKQETQRTNTELSVAPSPSPSGTQARTPQEYVIDRVISHRIKDHQKRPSAKLGERICRVRCYGFDRSNDKFEPILHISRIKIISYYKRNKQPLLNNLKKAQIEQAKLISITSWKLKKNKKKWTLTSSISLRKWIYYPQESFYASTVDTSTLSHQLQLIHLQPKPATR